MKLMDRLQRINGFSLPAFGLQWTPKTQEREIVRSFLTFMEDRRVLFVPECLEVRGQVEDSVLKIREECTQALKQLDEEAFSAQRIRAIRSACREFLVNKRPSFHIVDYRHPDWDTGFFVALGELRSQVGLQIGMLSGVFNIEIESDLASILPSYSDDK
jgi:hypothetical protein